MHTLKGLGLKAQFRESTFRPRVIVPEKARKAATACASAFSAGGEVCRHILEAVVRADSIKDIASDVASDFPVNSPGAQGVLLEPVRNSQNYG